MSEKKFAGYICTGCGIGERLKTGQLENIAKKSKMGVVKQHPMLCSQEGVTMIHSDITNEKVTHIMIAACSRRAKVEAFNFPEVAMSRANLREGVIWSRPDGKEHQEGTQEMAADYIRMACAEVRSMTPPQPSGEQVLVKRLLVVGGGITGMTAALESAAAGYAVTIVEKSGALGGHAAEMSRRVPTRSPYAEPEDTGIAGMIVAISQNSRIEVLLNTTITRTSGAPGRFAVDLSSESGSTCTETFGAIVQATGFRPYDAAQLPELGYGKSPDVITGLELERLVKATNGGPIKRPSDGRVVQSVAFVQCAGQRSGKPGHLPYCSGFCCTASIKQALYFKTQNPGCDTTVLFSDLRTPGVSGEDFYRAGQEKQVTFSKGQVAGVIPGQTLTVKFKDLILNEDTTMACDLVVLATGMVPNSGPDPYAAEGSVSVPVPSILNLEYRQGTDLPHLKYGFVDSHFICFPYETRRTGIYAAGPVRRPMDMKQAQDDATGAALKAIQAAENAGKGMAAHPRSGDLSFPKFRKEGCTQCKRCTVECPFGAINEDENRYPVFNESRCRRCGTCMGACPVRVISFENYSIETVGQQIKNIEMPDADEEKPRILVMACENDAYPALDMAAMSGIHISPYARIVPVRCLGSVSLNWITDSLNAGFDGVILMGCRKDEEYQCHYVRGSAIAHERLSKVGDTLQGMSLEVERVAVHEVAITDIGRAPRIINEMADLIGKIGLSPLKF